MVLQKRENEKGLEMGEKGMLYQDLLLAHPNAKHAGKRAHADEGGGRVGV